VRKRAIWGEHRTEVTEVTEGELAFLGERIQRAQWLMGEKSANLGRASHRGHGGHRGGTGVFGREDSEGAVADGREKREFGESIAQRSQRGELAL
jgi:hypothetical protein